METKREYGIRLNETGEVTVVGSDPSDREVVIHLAELWNDRKSGSFIGVERVTTVTDWEPFNTGVVPPRSVGKAEE